MLSAGSRYFASAPIGGWSFETWPPVSASAVENILLEVVSDPPSAAVVAFGMMAVAIAVRRRAVCYRCALTSEGEGFDTLAKAAASAR